MKLESKANELNQLSKDCNIFCEHDRAMFKKLIEGCLENLSEENEETINKIIAKIRRCIELRKQ